MACVAIGKIASHYLGGLPSSLYGLICFTTLLHTKVLSADKIQPSIEWAIKNMSICFVPAGVGIIEHFELIQQHGISIVAIIFISTFILLTCVGLIVEKSLQNSATSANNNNIKVLK